MRLNRLELPLGRFAPYGELRGAVTGLSSRRPPSSPPNSESTPSRLETPGITPGLSPGGRPLANAAPTPAIPAASGESGSAASSCLPSSIHLGGEEGEGSAGTGGANASAYS